MSTSKITLTPDQLNELAEWAFCTLCDIALKNDKEGLYTMNFHRNGHKESK
jgi:hypothetical protein